MCGVGGVGSLRCGCVKGSLRCGFEVFFKGERCKFNFSSLGLVLGLVWVYGPGLRFLVLLGLVWV